MAVATNGLVYLSHSVWNFGSLPVLPPFAASPMSTGVSRTSVRQSDPAVSPATVIPANFSWSQSSYLDVVDLSDPAAPTVRPAVSIPGPLAGVSRGGNVLYTVSSSTQAGQNLVALAYDGVDVYQVASLPLGAPWNASPVVYNETVFTAQTDSTYATNWLGAWILTDQAAFAELGETTLGSPINALATFHALLGVQTGAAVLLFNAAQPAALQSIGIGSAPNCLWPSLAGADGGLNTGLWSPLGDYGVFNIGVSP